MAVLDFAGQIGTETCANCGIEFGMPMHFIKARREDKKPFYCPNGHSLSFNGSEVDRLRRELEEKDRALKTARESRDSANERAERTWRTLRQTQGKLNATKKRIAGGVCPCCNRTFVGSRLARHLATKHPDYQNPEPEVGGASR